MPLKSTKSIKESKYEKKSLINADIKQKENMFWNDYRQKNDTFVTNFCHGLMRITVKCGFCKDEAPAFEPFNVLSINLSGNKYSTTLSSCLQAFFSSEILNEENKWECDKCKKKRNAIKTNHLAKLPKTLIIHLKRFKLNRTSRGKIGTKVEYPIEGLVFPNEI